MTQPPQPPPVPSSFGPVPGPNPSQQKKTNVVVWVLLGIAGLLIAGVLIAAATTYYFVKQVAGSGNPAIAIAKVITTLNPDLEVISMDGDTVRVRVKSTGQETEINISDIKKGKIDIKSPDGRVVIGGKARMPDWLPKYPGMEGDPVTQVESLAKGKGTVVFHTSDKVEKVTAWYEQTFKDGGFTVERKVNLSAAQNVAILKAESGAKDVVVTVVDGTLVTLVYSLGSVN